MIFQEFLELKKIAKKVLYEMDPPGADVARHGPLRAHMGAYVARRSHRLLIGPTGKVG